MNPATSGLVNTSPRDSAGASAYRATLGRINSSTIGISSCVEVGIKDQY
jgi:hypothetical protein